ncbi:hypothetical protein CRENPOLYSF1_440030 [Crenothrix polyspora]|uniref:Uncharacterized protein n=1 Tax=Crenothrix polyspora TaxID=360316 RepID=A0A1R4HBF0_9GAMM|nr:hypothetical protein CRENPOLYSF1_440030 [Crenothrix polyspora]
MIITKRIFVEIIRTANTYSVTVRTELVEVCRSCFDKLNTNGGCNCPKLKTL